MIDLEKYKNLPVQRSDEWKKMRLGLFNASEVSALMGKKMWTQTALTYINNIATERSIAKDVIEDDDMFWLYLELTSCESKATRWGNDHEQDARDIYSTKHGVVVTEVSSIKHPDMPFFACSSDGLVVETNSGIEIKCPLPKTYWLYRTEVHDGESLKAVKPEYYWQIMSQICICDLDYVDFVAYCEFMEKPLHEARIEPNKEDINLLVERVYMANEMIKEKWNL